MSKKFRLRTPFNSQHVNVSQILLESARHNFYQISSSISAKLTWKTSLLVICEIPGHFVIFLSPDDKYSLPNSENFPQLIKMQLSKKRIISQMFSPFLISISILQHFGKKDNAHSLCISEYTDCTRST